MFTCTRLKSSVLIAGVISLMGFLSANSAQAFSLTILHNNDGESKILPRGDSGGAAFFTSLVKGLRTNATTDAVLTLSSGDNFLAGTAFNASLQNGTFYDAIVLNEIGYDAIALGNHDFDFGPDILADFINSAEFTSPVPFLSSNLDFSNEPRLQELVNTGRISGSVVVNKGGERIGVVGATTPLLPAVSSPRNVQVDPDVAGNIQAEIDALQAQGVDKIILISHLQSIEEELALIPQLKGVDVVIAGGGDELLANPDTPLLPADETATPFGPYPLTATNADGDTVPVVTTTGEYRYVGQFEVEFDDAGKVVAFKGAPVRVFSGDGITPDPTVQSQAVIPVEQAIADLAANILATSEVDLNGLRSDVRTKETNLGNLIADSLLATGIDLADDFGLSAPQIALQNGGGIRNDSLIPAGDFSELDTFNSLPFDNFVSIVPDVEANTFKEILENAVSRIEFVDGRFAQIAGFKFAYDLAGTAQIIDTTTGAITTAGTRVKTVILDDGTVIVEDGQVVANAPSISIATINFLARGGDQYPFGGADFTSLGLTYQQALANYVANNLGGQIRADQYPVDGNSRTFVGEIPDEFLPPVEPPVEPPTEPGVSVPEPSSVLAMLTLGAIGAGSLKKRKQAKREV